MPTHRSRPAGFTLIELLVVIAIIAILAAILFPVFAQAKLAAKKSAGLAQMKQIGTALFMYEGDNDDGLPTWDWYQTVYPAGAYRDGVWAAAGSPILSKRTWDAALMPYVKDASFDKAATLATSEFSGIWKSPGIEYDPKNGRSIGINQLVSYDIMQNSTNTGTDTNINSGAYVYRNMSQMVAPAETLFVGDSGTQGRIEQFYFLNGYQESWLTKPARPQYSRPWRYGGDSANYAFLDGHASSIKGDKIYPNPSKTHAIASWSAAQKAQLICSSARYQAGTSADRQALADAATAAGVNCQVTQ